jgi:subtilisin family serine protease
LQLKVLLGLNDTDAGVLASKRPFASSGEFAAAAPAHAQSKIAGMTLDKLDINTATPDSFTAIGIPKPIADEVVKRRPFHLMMELMSIPNMVPDFYDKISQISAIPALSYVDKLSGTGISLSPNPSKILVRFHEGEAGSARRSLQTLGATRVGLSVASQYDLIEAPETETGGSLLAKAKATPGVSQVLPGLKDEAGALRFVDPTRLVIQFRANAVPTNYKVILGPIGLTLVQQHRTPGLVTVQCDAASTAPNALYTAINLLNGRDDVQFAEPAYIGVNDIEGGALAVQSAPAVALPWHLQMLAATGAWSKTTGAPGVVIALIDTGVDDTHPALTGAILAPSAGDDWDFDTDSGKPTDTDGHGTFIAGLLVGNGADGVVGLCPNCKLLPLKVPLLGDAEDYPRRRDAILYAIQYARGKKLIINLSWKTQGDVALIRDAINQAQDAGVCVVASAGNWPTTPDEPHFPSDYPWVISVGSVGSDGRRSQFSFYGQQVDVAAPGGDGDGRSGDIISAALGGGTRLDFGTSFSAPLVAGVIALQFAADGTYSTVQARNLIESTARAVVDDGLGRGLVNASDALGVAADAANNLTTPAGPSHEAAITAVNEMSLSDLVSAFGFPSITARLIIVKRPIQTIEEVEDVLGMTDALYQTLLAFEE